MVISFVLAWYNGDKEDETRVMTFLEPLSDSLEIDCECYYFGVWLSLHVFAGLHGCVVSD